MSFSSSLDRIARRTELEVAELDSEDYAVDPEEDGLYSCFEPLITGCAFDVFMLGSFEFELGAFSSFTAVYTV